MTHQIIDETTEPVAELSEQVKAIVNQLASCKRELLAIVPAWYNLALIQNNLSVRASLIEQLLAVL